MPLRKNTRVTLPRQSEAQGLEMRSSPHAASQGCSDYSAVNAMKSIRQGSNPCTSPVGETEWVTLSPPRLKTTAEVQARRNLAPSCSAAVRGQLWLHWAAMRDWMWSRVVVETSACSRNSPNDPRCDAKSAQTETLVPRWFFFFFLSFCRENKWSFCVKSFW